MSNETLQVIKDPLLDKAMDYVKKEGNVSQIKLQLKFSLGYMRASKIIQQLESLGILDDSRQGNYVVLRNVKTNGLCKYVSPKTYVIGAHKTAVCKLNANSGEYEVLINEKPFGYGINPIQAWFAAKELLFLGQNPAI